MANSSQNVLIQLGLSKALKGPPGKKKKTTMSKKKKSLTVTESSSLVNNPKQDFENEEDEDDDEWEELFARCASKIHQCLAKNVCKRAMGVIGGDVYGKKFYQSVVL